jgi:hypothetical protein
MTLPLPMMTESKFPNELIATRALIAVTDLLFPNTAVKKRAAVSSLEVRMVSFGTNKIIYEQRGVL